MNPETRLLKQVTIENAAEADEIFSMLMGDDVNLDASLSSRTPHTQTSMLKA